MSEPGKWNQVDYISISGKEKSFPLILNYQGWDDSHLAGGFSRGILGVKNFGG
jgi:hypothetical protein